MRLRTIIWAIAIIAFAAYGIARLTRGPSTKDEVCASFDSLGSKMAYANGFFDNAVFSQASDLSDVAGRYKGVPDLSSDADALGRIGDAKSTNTLQLMNATRHIAGLCGHPLGIGGRTFG